MIPLVDLKAQYQTIKPEIDAAVARVLASTAFIQGPEVQGFEKAFASWCGAKHCVGVGSGTAALQLALLAAGVGPGDEVLTSSLTFMATAEAIVQTGARPVFADVTPGTLNLDPVAAEKALTPRTKAILPVHLYGRPADMDAFATLAQKRGLRLIEDAAQAHGARYKGRMVGTLAESACFSFYPGKNLGAYGDAGAVVTDDDRIADQVRLLRDHGRKDKYEHLVSGFGHRLDGLQAAILAAKLPHLAAWTQARQRHAAAYRELLAGLKLTLPAPEGGDACVYHLFVIEVEQRDRVLAELQAAGIGAGIHYPIPLHLQPAFTHLGYKRGDFPVAEKACDRILSLPIYPEITDAQRREVAGALKKALG